MADIGLFQVGGTDIGVFSADTVVSSVSGDLAFGFVLQGAVVDATLLPVPISGTMQFGWILQGGLTPSTTTDRVPGAWGSGQIGGISNPLDYDPPPTAASTTLSAKTVDSITFASMSTSSPANGSSFDVVSSTGFTTPTATTLAVELEDIDLDITLTDASSFEESGVVKIGSERISYANKNGNVLERLERGAFGTTIVTHVVATSVYQAEYVLVESERIAYHTLSSNTFGDIIREAPVIHRGSRTCAANVDIGVASVTGMATSGWVQVGDEQIHYASITGTTLEGISRAANGTSVSDHASSSAVTSFGYSPIGTATSRIVSSPALFVLNGDTSTISSGTLVGWQGVAGGGGGVVGISDGDGALGITTQDIVVGGWGSVSAGGVASMILDATTLELPGPGEPVFAKSSTTVKSLENANYSDVSIGRCLRTHVVDYDGETTISPARVDFVVVSQALDPFPGLFKPAHFCATILVSQTITTAAFWVRVVFGNQIRVDDEFSWASNSLTFNFDGWVEASYTIGAQNKAAANTRNEARWRMRLTVAGPTISTVPGSISETYHRDVSALASNAGRGTGTAAMLIEVSNGDSLTVEGASAIAGGQIVLTAEGGSFKVKRIEPE